MRHIWHVKTATAIVWGMVHGYVLIGVIRRMYGHVELIIARGLDGHIIALILI